METSNFLMSKFWKPLTARLKKAFDIHARRNKAEHDLISARDRIVELEDLLAINNDNDTTGIITWNSENPFRGAITRHNRETEDLTPKDKEQREYSYTH